MSLSDDLNDLVRSPDGKVAESKVFSVVFKAAMTYVFVASAEKIIMNWEILSVFVVAMIAPDLLKKLIATRAGIAEGKE